MYKIYFCSDGRLGNQIIQYFACIVLNKILGNTHEIEFISNINTNLNSIIINDFEWTKLCHKYYNIDFNSNELVFAFSKYYNTNVDIDENYINKLKNNNIYLTDYYQRSEVYRINNIRELLLNIVNDSNNFNKIIGKNNLTIGDIMNNNYKMPTNNELVIHIRLDDFFTTGDGEVLNPEYYLSSINEICNKYNNIDTLTIVVDKLRNNDEKYVKYLIQNCPQHLNIKLHQKSIFEDFNYLRTAKYLISSNATFSWIASYLSNAIIVVVSNYNIYLSPHQGRKAITYIDTTGRCIVKDLQPHFTRIDVDNLIII